MSFYELIKSRRSIRRFTDQQVEPEKIKTITRAALMAPSSRSSNPWEFVVVQDKEMLQKLSECRTGSSQLIAGAPLAIVVSADPGKSNVWFEDASIAALIMQLQAEDLELGSCWVQVYKRNKDDNRTSEEYIRPLINLPEEQKILCIIAIGYKSKERSPYDDDKLQEEKIHFEKYKPYETE